MAIYLRDIILGDKKKLAKLVRNYHQELFGGSNQYKYRYLDSYWVENDRHPCYIMLDDIVVGFALINKHTILSKSANNLAEFYIKPEYRKRGLGNKAAREVFKRYPGKWEVRVLKENALAYSFWKKVLSVSTTKNFKETLLDESEWKGSVFTFWII